MSQEWVILELSSRAEGEDPAVIEKAIRHSIKGADVFIPAVVTQIGEDRNPQYLVDGYAFVKKVLPDNAYLRLENTRFVQSLLLAPGSSMGRQRKLATVRDKDIDNFRNQIKKESDQDISIGDRVLITTGPYRNIEAEVIDELSEQGLVQVFIKLRSKETIVKLPRSGLQVVERAVTSPLYNRLFTLRTWFRVAKPILTWPGFDMKALEEKFSALRAISDWTVAYQKLFSFVGFHYNSVGPKIEVLCERLEELERITAWLEKASPLYTFVGCYYGDSNASFKAVQAKLVTLQWLDGVLGRIRKLHHEVESLGKDETLTQNVLIDGMNLFFRCLHAPGISELKDAEGRATGAIYGFLRSIASMKKQYPEARIYVAWDGSSKRRKQKYGEYKANRNAHGGLSFQLDFIHSILPHIGVWQALNSDEEADDIIGTLVKTTLSSERNLILSTDRDFLQLVTDKTSVLIPGAGNRHDIVYGPKEVCEDYGVDPCKIVQLRSFYGDDSDNLPGVPRVPKKIFRSLIQTYGSVDGVYSSGLSGLSKAQYERLRSSEPQVRINLDLMALVDVPVTVQDPDLDPDRADEQLQTIGVNRSICDAFFGQRT